MAIFKGTPKQQRTAKQSLTSMYLGGRACVCNTTAVMVSHRGIFDGQEAVAGVAMSHSCNLFRHSNNRSGRNRNVEANVNAANG
jgi:hypothetical protein